MRLSQQMGSLIPLFLSLVILVILGALGSNLIQQAPHIKRLDYVQIKPSPQAVDLGWRELGQHRGINSAEKQHLRLKYLQDQNWQLSNIASAKRVDLQTTKVDTRYLRRAALEAGDILHFNTFKLQVKQADTNGFVLFNPANQQTGSWEGTALTINGKSGYPACERQGLRRFLGGVSDSVHWLIRNMNPQQTLRLFSLGGQVHCTSRWKQKDLPPDAFRFYWQNGQYWIAQGSEPSRVAIKRKGKSYDLKYLSLTTHSDEGSIRRAILGRTHYLFPQVDKNLSNTQLLTLKPISNQQVFQIYPDDDTLSEEDRAVLLKKKADEKQQLEAMASRGIIPVYKQHDWIGQSVTANPFGLRSLFIFGFFLVFGTAYTFLAYQWRRQAHGHSPLGLLAVATTITLLLSWAALAWRGDLGIALSILWVSVTWTTLLLSFTGRLNHFTRKLWFLALVLAGIGTLTLTQLAAGADNTRWLRYATSNVFMLSQLATILALMALIPLPALNGIWMLFVHNKSKLLSGIKIAIIALILFFLAMQFAIGTEQGIWGIQPVEVAKLLIIVIAAHALWHLKMLRAIHSRYYRENPKARIFMFLWVLLAVILISLLISVGVHDYSPTLIVMALMAAFLWQAIPHPVKKQPLFTWVFRGVTILLPLLILIGFGLLFYQNPPDYDSSIPQAERLRIWANPTLYPEAASQLLNSLARIGQGGWLGNHWFGNNGNSMQIPAVQDDFIAAFLLNRFGGLAGLFLLLIQFLWVNTLFGLSKQLTQPQRNQDLHASHNILGNIIFGLAWVHLLHWMISWGNVLGLLPIMGQPMTWLSAGNSHLLAIGAMTLVLALLGSSLLVNKRS
ncbi:MAG: FtsW/RodA/SpoVE family cell cycle protein [Cocleimonas sp.]|nr:FtsW/RodA/SpoVE family cell cycle protein [Cocleimonas sp.]